MALNYLDKFRSTLPETQGNQIRKLLRQKRDTGEIVSLDEFRANLAELTQELLAQKITPSLQLFLGEQGDLIASDTYNFMLDRIKDDLEAVFIEATRIDEILNAHNQLIRNVALQTMYLAINELESKVKIYSFLNGAGLHQGFDTAQFNTFRLSDSIALGRATPDAPIVYRDFKIGDSVGNTKNPHN